MKVILSILFLILIGKTTGKFPFLSGLGFDPESAQIDSVIRGIYTIKCSNTYSFKAPYFHLKMRKN